MSWRDHCASLNPGTISWRYHCASFNPALCPGETTAHHLTLALCPGETTVHHLAPALCPGEITEHHLTQALFTGESTVIVRDNLALNCTECINRKGSTIRVHLLVSILVAVIDTVRHSSKTLRIEITQL